MGAASSFAPAAFRDRYEEALLAHLFCYYILHLKSAF
jgi:hypothetical protein